MKNKISRFKILLSVFSIISFVSLFTNEVNADKLVVTRYYYDYNFIKKQETNHHGYEKQWVPNKSYMLEPVYTQVSSGWNYYRYRVDQLWHKVY